MNTSSCPGLLKEIIVDRTLNGKVIFEILIQDSSSLPSSSSSSSSSFKQPFPTNVFIVAACNPYRGNSMASHGEEIWVRGTYYVRPLHPTLELLMWDYGALDSDQERDYIHAKIQMLNRQLPNLKVVLLTELIMESQSLMRQYAYQQFLSQDVPPSDAEVCIAKFHLELVSEAFLLCILFTHLSSFMFSSLSSFSSSSSSSFFFCTGLLKELCQPEGHSESVHLLPVAVESV